MPRFLAAMNPHAMSPGVIADVKPSWIIRHWKNRVHRDHALTHTIVPDAVLLAVVGGMRGMRGVYYAANW